MNLIAGKFPVPTDLQALIHCFWFAGFEGLPGTFSPAQRSLPSGMIEMIINPSTRRCRVLHGGKWVETPAIYLEGVKSAPAHWQLEAGCQLFGISIKPEAMAVFFEQPLGELARRFTDATTYLGDWLGDLMSQMQAVNKPEARANVATEFFRAKMARLKEKPQSTHHYLIAALEHLREENGVSSLEALSSRSLISPRQLQRSFQENIGFSPKAYGRIVRLQKIFEYFDRHPKASMMDIAYEFGYCDQSHFIREFKAFTGEKPKKLLSGTFNTPLAVAI